MSWWLRRADDDDDEAMPTRHYTPPPPSTAEPTRHRLDIDFTKHRDGSIASLSCDATGFRLIRTSDNGVLIEVARAGEEPVWIQVRGVGRDVAGIRAMFTGET